MNPCARNGLGDTGEASHEPASSPNATRLTHPRMATTAGERLPSSTKKSKIRVREIARTNL